MGKLFEIVYMYINQEVRVKILADNYEHARKQFDEMNTRINMVMSFINAYEVE
jgi:hypothetical protein